MPRFAEPAFTVVVPTLDRAATIGRAIESVVAQTWTDFELLVVDDGSTDDTRAVVARFQDERVRYLRRAHRGRSAARNHGAEVGRGRWLTFLDSDDHARPAWLGRLENGLRTAPIACCGALCVTRSADGATVASRARLPEPLGPAFGDATGLFLAGTYALDRRLFLAAGGFDPRLRFSENTELALRLAARVRDDRGRIACVAEPLVVYEQRPDRLTADGYAARLDAAETILDRHGEVLRTQSPPTYLTYHGIAGVNAARLGDLRRARRHFSVAQGLRRGTVLNQLRWLATFAPGARGWVWRARGELRRPLDGEPTRVGGSARMKRDPSPGAGPPAR